MQWFRFYTEAISDKKLRRIARDTNECMAHVLGVWTIILSMASDSPQRGVLLLSDTVPATIDDINDAAGCNVTETFMKLLVTGLVTEHVTNDGKKVYSVPAWNSRQFESDSSATRVKRHRERKKAAQNVTAEKRYSNAPDTDTEDIHTASTAPTPKPSKPKRDKGESAPQQEYFGPVCVCVGWDHKTITEEQKGRVAQTMGVLQKAGYTLDDLRTFWCCWHDEDWRGQKGQLPTLSQLRAEIGKIRAYTPPAAANGKVTGFSLAELTGGA